MVMNVLVGHIGDRICCRTQQPPSQQVKRMKDMGYTIGNIDSTLIAERPKLSPYKEQIRENLCTLLEAHPSVVNIKVCDDCALSGHECVATTTNNNNNLITGQDA